jgi:hypothetical protein
MAIALLSATMVSSFEAHWSCSAASAGAMTMLIAPVLSCGAPGTLSGTGVMPPTWNRMGWTASSRHM